MDLEIHIHIITKSSKINPSFSHMMAKTIPTKFFFSLFSILTITLCLMPTQTLSSTLEADTIALHELKRAIDPSSLTPSSYLNSWDFRMDPCESTGSQFLGILCNSPLDNSSSRVTQIDLDGIGYEGFLTPAIGNLTELTLLNLNNNIFRGPIPEAIGNLRKLTRLTISENFFTGEIPQTVTKLKNLQYLDLSGNKLSGSIPKRFSGLRSLTFLSLSNNGFASRIPNLTGLWQLNTLDLSFNQFYGYLPNLPWSLRNMYLSHNILSGHIAPLKGLIHLKRVDISDNRLSGSINRDIFSLQNVVHLNVSFNRFTTLDVMSHSFQGSRLQVLEAEWNNLRGHLPVNLVTFKNLTTINLSNNQFSGSIPKEYGTKVRSSWKRLYLDHNFLTGNVPAEFAQTATNVRVSIARNCLKCPTNVVLCRGGQRPATECAGQHSG